MKTSLVAGVYENAVDRESAYEILKGRAGQPAAGGRSAIAGTGAAVVRQPAESWLARPVAAEAVAATA